MKLLRYGPRARKSPVCSIATARSATSPARSATSTARRCRRPRSTGCAGSTRRPCRWYPARRGSARASAGVEDRRDRPQLPAACRGGRRADPQGADLLHEGDLVDLRPERRRDDPEGLAEDRLGGRARHRHRQHGALRRGARRAEAHRRLLRRQRRLRARIPDRARRAVDQGQERRHLLPDRSLARHRRRGARTPASCGCGPRSTASGCRTATPPT